MLSNTQGIKKKTYQVEGIIGVVVSRFNSDITNALKEGALRALKEATIKEDQIEIYEVPGAFEIPLIAQELGSYEEVSGVICLGAVIRGETSHYDYVCQGVTQGILNAQLEAEVPMSFGILTTDNLQQAQARASDNDENKGYEAAWVVLEMIDTLFKIRNS